MATLTLFVLILGVFLPAAFSEDQGKCPESGDDAIDISKEKVGTKWYYCQTSLEGRTKENCHLEITSTSGNKFNLTVCQYNIGADGTTQDDFTMEHVGPGKYSYPGRHTHAVMLKVTPQKDCWTYWKCPKGGADWNGVASDAAYFMYLCNDPEKCKPQTEYTGDYKAIWDEAMAARPELAGKVFDIDQSVCKTKCS